MHPNGHHHSEPLPPPTAAATEGYFESVIEALGDTPETVIPLQFLRERSCEVLCVGDPAELEGVVIQALEMPMEPIAFGSSAEAIASLMPHLEGWTCVNLPSTLVDDLLVPIGEMSGASNIRLLDDVYHTLTSPITPVAVDGVRLLLPDDRALIHGAPEALIGDGADRLIQTMNNGHIAGAIRDGALVSLAYTFAISDRHADIGVVTHPEWRGQGLAAAVSGLVAQAIQQGGRIPVWSCGAPNIASMRIANHLGFVEVSRRTYLIPEFD